MKTKTITFYLGEHEDIERTYEVMLDEWVEHFDDPVQNQNIKYVYIYSGGDNEFEKMLKGEAEQQVLDNWEKYWV